MHQPEGVEHDLPHHQRLRKHRFCHTFEDTAGHGSANTPALKKLLEPRLTVGASNGESRHCHRNLRPPVESWLKWVYWPTGKACFQE